MSLAYYEKLFGSKAPEHIWEPVDVRFGKELHSCSHINVHRLAMYMLKIRIIKPKDLADKDKVENPEAAGEHKVQKIRRQITMYGQSFAKGGKFFV